MNFLFQMCGWVGALGLLTAFYLNSTDKIKATNRAYQWMNFFSALMLTINAFYIDSYPFIIINLFWAGVALFSIYRLSTKTKNKANNNE